MANKVRKFFDARATGEDKKKNKEVGKMLSKKAKDSYDVIKLLLLGRWSCIACNGWTRV